MLGKSDIRRGLRISTWEGAAGQVHNVLVSNALLSGFALAWGANDFHLGLLGAIPFLGQLFQFVGAYLVDRWADRRRQIVASLGLVARSIWFIIAVLPFLLNAASLPVLPFVLMAFLVYQLIYCASGPGWVAWLAVLVPDRLRGRYLGRRSLIIELIGVLTALAAGRAIDLFRKAGHETPGFAVLQMFAGGAGIVCFVLMLRQPDPGHRTPHPELRWPYLLRPLEDMRFRALCAFNLCWCFGLNVSLPFLNAFLLKNQHWNFTHLAILGVISSLASVLMNPLWGKMADRRGCKPVLKLCALGLLQVPLYYVFCPANLKWPIYLSGVISGIFSTGFNLAVFSLTLGSLPAQARTMGSAVLNAVTGPAIFLSGVLSGWVAQHLIAAHWQAGNLTLVNYQLMFLLSVLLRAPTLVLLNRLREPQVSHDRKDSQWIRPQPAARES